MMECNGDDQGTGWFEVKKKYRSSSKISLQSWVGGISGRNSSNLVRGQPSVSDSRGNSRDKHRHPNPKGEDDCPALGIGQSSSVRTSVSASHEKKQNVQVPNSAVASKATECPKSSSPPVGNSVCVIKSCEKAPQKGGSNGAGIKFGAIGDDNLITLADIEANCSVVSGANSRENSLDQMNQVSLRNPELEDQESCEVISRDIEVPVMSENADALDSDVVQVKKVDDIYNNLKLVSDDETEPKVSEEQPTSSAFSGGLMTLNDDATSDIPSMSALGESDTVESKERFRQRLWCFLFENLNRAVDELYLLCELECDVEQMKEAILVLEEASCDFTDLTLRVEEFESMKKQSPRFTNGAAINLKSDHRRPHALSWEVRRMTTSAHKAEILSSSLEAFKKIQRERASLHQVTDAKGLQIPESGDTPNNSFTIDDTEIRRTEALIKDRRSTDNGHVSSKPSSSHLVTSKLPPRDNVVVGKAKREAISEKNAKQMDTSSRDKERRSLNPWKSLDAWKEKRNWRDILSSPFRMSSRSSHLQGIMNSKSAERARMLHDKLMSPEKKKKTAIDMRKEAAEKHARATKIRSELENERAQKLQKTSEKLTRVSEWQAVRSLKLRQGMHARQQKSETRHEAFLAQVVKRAGDESSKVNEVRFITSLNEENKKLILRQKLHGSELRRAEKLQVMKSKQKEDMAREEAVLERRKMIEAEKLQRLAEIQKRKEEALIKREEERKASSAAREARALEQLRRKEERAKAQQEESELLAQKLAEKLSESEQRRKIYLEQIRERASINSRDQSSPLLRRSINKEGQNKYTPNNNGEDHQASLAIGSGDSNLAMSNFPLQHSMKRRIKRIRQRLMAFKYDFSELPLSAENGGIGYRTAIGTARVRIGRWLQELQRLRQARKEGAASIGLITAEMIKYLEGKDAELQASRQAGLLDFIASALPASHTSKPEACHVTIHLLKLLKVVLSVSPNRSYFIAQNLLPPSIPMLSAALENYIKIAASLNIPGNTNLPSSKTSAENFESITQVLDGFLWTVTVIIGHINSDEQQIPMRDGLLELLTAYQVIHRLRDLFALYDRPQVEGSPFPSSILLSIYLLVVLTSRPETKYLIDWESLYSETSDNGFSVESSSMLSCGKGMILPDVPEESPLERTKVDGDSVLELADVDTEKEQTKYILEDIPSVSDERREVRIVDAAVKSFSQKDDKNSFGKNENVSNLDQPMVFLLSAISETGLVSLLSVLTAVLLQANSRLSTDQGSYVLPSNFEEVATGVLKVLNNLALFDLKFLQSMLARPDLKMEFFHLLSFLLTHCNSKWKTTGDQVGMLLLESLSLLGHFALFQPGNQAVLRWGKTPTILHKICDLPFVFFSDPELMPILASTLVAACYGSEQNKGVVQQEISTDMLISLLQSCRNTQIEISDKKAPIDLPLKSARHNSRNSKVSFGKSSGLGNSTKNGKLRSKTTKTYEETAPKPCMAVSETSPMMLHCRLSLGFIDKAESFFSSEPLS